MINFWPLPFLCNLRHLWSRHPESILMNWFWWKPRNALDRSRSGRCTENILQNKHLLINTNLKHICAVSSTWLTYDIVHTTQHIHILQPRICDAARNTYPKYTMSTGCLMELKRGLLGVCDSHCTHPIGLRLHHFYLCVIL